MTLEDISHRIQTNATVLNVAIMPALRSLAENTAGFPKQASMGGYEKDVPSIPAPSLEYIGRCPELYELANGRNIGTITCGKVRPCPTHDTAITLTQPEAMSQQRDRARTDQARIARALHQADKHLRIAADIALFWGKPGDNSSDVAKKLATIDELIWCSNCAAHGHKNVRTHGNYCEFCADVKSKYKQYPTKELLEIKATRRVYVQDIQRCFKRQREKSRTLTRNPVEARARQTKRIDGAA